MSEKTPVETVRARVKRRACTFNLPPEEEGGEVRSFTFGDGLDVTREVLESHPTVLELEETFLVLHPEFAPTPEPEPEVDQAEGGDSEDLLMLDFEEE